jgi:hypothetical protein
LFLSCFFKQGFEFSGNAVIGSAQRMKPSPHRDLEASAIDCAMRAFYCTGSSHGSVAGAGGSGSVHCCEECLGLPLGE